MNEGDEPFEGFYRAHFLRLVLFLMHSGASVQEAEDAAQETMECAFSTWSRLRDPAAWVRVVAYRNYVGSAVRAQRTRASWVRAGTPDGETELFTDEERLVINVLRQLPPSQREVMAWFFDGFRPVEIAKKLGKPAATVRSDLRHARDQLRRYLRQPEDNRPQWPPELRALFDGTTINPPLAESATYLEENRSGPRLNKTTAQPESADEKHPEVEPTPVVEPAPVEEVNGDD